VIVLEIVQMIVNLAQRCLHFVVGLVVLELNVEVVLAVMIN